MREKFLWVEKYRPQVIEDCILPKDTKDVLKGFISRGEIPNLLLYGPAGIGKTTVAKALCDELGVDSYVINGSDEGRFLDTVRNTAKAFASTRSLTSTAKHKVIIIDEADNTTNDVQLLLRASIEEFSSNCRFIFTCNYVNKIIEPLHSRCAVVDFTIRGKDKAFLASQFFNRVREILVKENIEYDDKVIAEIITKHFPDFRRILNELQRYSSTGSINVGILKNASSSSVDELMEHLKSKKFNNVRKWVNGNLDSEPSILFRAIYDGLYSNLEGPSIAQAILIIAKYQYQAAFVADQEINTLACLTEIMVECF
jgi:DNA polymerase III delta prime subunit